MRIKTMFIIFVTVLLTVVVMQNTKEVPFNFLFATFYVSKLVMLLAVAVVVLEPATAVQAGVRVGGRGGRQRRHHRRDARVGRGLPAQVQRVGERVGAPVAARLVAAGRVAFVPEPVSVVVDAEQRAERLVARGPVGRLRGGRGCCHGRRRECQGEDRAAHDCSIRLWTREERPDASDPSSPPATGGRAPCRPVLPREPYERECARGPAGRQGSFTAPLRP